MMVHKAEEINPTVDFFPLKVTPQLCFKITVHDSGTPGKQYLRIHSLPRVISTAPKIEILDKSLLIAPATTTLHWRLLLLPEENTERCTRQ